MISQTVYRYRISIATADQDCLTMGNMLGRPIRRREALLVVCKKSIAEPVLVHGRYIFLAGASIFEAGA